MSTPFLQGVGAGSIRSGTSVFYGAIGEVIVERAGIVNLGLEGCMLMGACAGFIAAAELGNAYLALIVAALAGGIFNLGFGFLVVTRRANQLASGLTMGFLALGLTAIAGKDYVGTRIDGLARWELPVLSRRRGQHVIPHRQCDCRDIRHVADQRVVARTPSGAARRPELCREQRCGLAVI